VTIESSIAPHLRRDRTFPTRKSDEWQPPFPAFSARFPSSVTTVVMAYFGVQWPQGDPPPVVEPALAGLRAALAGTDGAGNVDLTRYVDEAGYETRIAIAYWDDPAVFDRWSDANPWITPERAGQGAGFFTEVLRPTVDRFETLFASGRLEGVSELSEGLSGEVREHGYWGGARDRMPLAQVDRLSPAGEPQLTVDGPVRTVTAGSNPCLIRSGQEWSGTADDERELYLNDVEPHLHAGMDFLRDEGRAVGCYLNRYMNVCDDEWNATEQTFGQSWWHSMEELDTWAEAHPTHLEIFRAAMRYLATMGANAKLNLYHEVSVAEGPSDTSFVYLDCHDRTGMLRAVTG
jgi:aldoxime dehydratase